MQWLSSPSGVTVSYEKYGSGPSLVLVHGSFSDHRTNWEFIKPLLAERFTVYAIARRGRGKTDATEWHSVMDEAEDVSTVVKAIPEPVFLLGHSYGAHVALAAAMKMSDHITKLVLYEPPRTDLPGVEALSQLEELARAGEWAQFARTFFRDTLLVPTVELKELETTELWPPIVADARASLGDMRALTSYTLDLDKVSKIQFPLVLQYGSESPRDLFLTDILVSVLMNAQTEELLGQGHEGMTTAPEQYVASLFRHLLS